MSNATKTVSNAQADREKRQAERLRLKAAGNIQRTWRGHKVRRTLDDSRRLAFDNLYNSDKNGPADPETLHFAFNILLAFFSVRRTRDLERLVLFVRDCEHISLEEIAPSDAHPSRMLRFARILVDAVQAAAQEMYVSFKVTTGFCSRFRY